MYNKKSFEETLQHFSFKKEQFERALQMTREEVTDEFIQTVQEERKKTNQSIDEMRKNKSMMENIKPLQTTREIKQTKNTDQKIDNKSNNDSNSVSLPKIKHKSTQENNNTKNDTKNDTKDDTKNNTNKSPKQKKKVIYASIVED